MNAPDRERPLALRLSVTDRCQLRCGYCMPEEGIAKRPRNEILSYEEIVRFVRTLRNVFPLSKVHVTGGDPLLRPGIVEFIRSLHAESIPEIVLTTNGQRLAETATELKRAGLTRVNVSLDSLDRGPCLHLTRVGELQRTLEGIDTAVAQNFSCVKLNMVVLKDINDDEVVDVARYGLARGCVTRFLELMPIGVSKAPFRDRLVSTAEVQSKLAGSFDLQPIPGRAGASSRDYSATDREGRKGVVGFISSYTAPFCTGCRRLRLTATGRLIGCLARGEGPRIRALIGDEDRLIESVLDTLRLKRNDTAAHSDAGQFAISETMSDIGG